MSNCSFKPKIRCIFPPLLSPSLSLSFFKGNLSRFPSIIDNGASLWQVTPSGCFDIFQRICQQSYSKGGLGGGGRGLINFLSFAFPLLNNVLIALSLSPSLILSLLQRLAADGPQSVTDEFVRGTRQLELPRTGLGQLNVTPLLAPASSPKSQLQWHQLLTGRH